MALFHFFTGKQHIEYVEGEYSSSIDAYNHADDYAHFAVGAFHHADRVFYHALALVALLDTFNETEKAERMKEIDADLERLTTWASSCPDNFLHRKLLVEAELARRRGEFLEAMELYDRAIASARESGYVQIEAVACERAGEFWRGIGKVDFARSYFRAAYERYGEWGASRKTALMENAHPWLARERKRDSREALILGAMRAVLGSTTPEELVTSLSGAALKYTGAERLLFFVTIDGARFLLADAAGDRAEIGPVPMEVVAESPHRYPVEMVRFAFRKGTPVSSDMADTLADLPAECPYIGHNNPRSFLCLPCETERGRVAWYFEHGTAKGAFSGVSREVLEMMASQGAAVITRILGEDPGSTASLVLKEEGRNVTVPFAVITHFEADGRKTAVHVPGKPRVLNRLMKDVEGTLPPKAFIRVHRRFIVNTGFLEALRREGVNKYVIILKDENKTRLPVGRAFLPSIRKILGST